LADILSAARRGSALTRNLLGFARQGTRIKERFRIETAIESITHLLRRTIPKQVELRVEVAEGLDDIIGDPGQLSHVLMNLCINAVDAMEGRGSISIRAANLQLNAAAAQTHGIPEGRHVELCVEDTGAGIPPENLPRVFEPFFSTKNSNERSGLGLSMVYGTIRDHGGVVAIDSTVGVGTKIRILLPSQFRRPASIAPASVRALPPSSDRRSILLVDDEPLLRSAGRRIIKSLGFESLVAANGAEAVAVFRMHRDNIALVILDVAMPVMGGRDCFFRLRELDDQIPILVASGFAKHGGVDELLSAGATGYLAKPYDRDQMSAAIHRCLALSGALAPGSANVTEAAIPLPPSPWRS
jgi:CheY-like chemotaxis protein